MNIRMSLIILFLFSLINNYEMLIGRDFNFAGKETEKEESYSMYSDSSKIREIIYKEGKGFIALGKNGNELFEVFPFDNGPDYPSEGLFRIVEQGKIGYADEVGNIVIKPQFDAALPFTNGMAAFCKECLLKSEGEHKVWEGGKWGFINRLGNIAIPPKYDFIIDGFKNGIAKVEYSGSVILINKQGEQMNITNMKYNEWIALLGRTVKLAAKLFLGDNIKISLSWKSNDKFVFSAKGNREYLSIKVTKSESKELAEYDIIPPQNFAIRSRPGSQNNLISKAELITVTDYAVIYSILKPLKNDDIEVTEKFRKLFEAIVNVDKNNQKEEGDLNYPENIRIISDKIYKHYIDLQVAQPGTVFPADSVLMNICKGKMIYLQVIPDLGKIKKRWIKTADPPIDTYYTSVEDYLLQYFSEALDGVNNSPARRDEIFRGTNSKIRYLFSAANSYVNFLYDKYEARLRNWLFIGEKTLILPTEENIFDGYQPKQSPDIIVDYMPSLRDEIENLPKAELENYIDLFNLLNHYNEFANINPGKWEEGNIVLGANPLEYRPSKYELLASETGNRLKQILDTYPGETIIKLMDTQGLKPLNIEYTLFTFTHVDVMGSGRFFYVQSSEKIRLVLEKQK